MQRLEDGSISQARFHCPGAATQLRLPQPDAVRCCHFAPLLELQNDTGVDLRLELLEPSGTSWASVHPVVAPGAWSKGRCTPLWLPRVKAVRLVRASDGVEVWRRSPWADGGVVSVGAAGADGDAGLADSARLTAPVPTSPADFADL